MSGSVLVVTEISWVALHAKLGHVADVRTNRKKKYLDYVHHFLNIDFLLVFGAINCLLEESHKSEVGEDASRSWNIINGLLLVVDLGITTHYKLLPEHANGEMSNWGFLNIWDNRLMRRSLEDQAKESVRIKWNEFPCEQQSTSVWMCAQDLSFHRNFGMGCSPGSRLY